MSTTGTIRLPSWFVSVVAAVCALGTPWVAWTTKALIEISTRQEKQIEILQQQQILGDRIRDLERVTTVNSGRLTSAESAIVELKSVRHRADN